MEKPCDWQEGMKHRCTAAMLRHLRVETMRLCQEAGLYQIDLLNGTGERITEKEYWAQRRGQRRPRPRQPEGSCFRSAHPANQI